MTKSLRGATTTNLQNTEAGYVAPARLRDNLQAVVVDFIALGNLGKQAHWNLVGPNFRDLHLNIDEVVEIAREGADTFAERMRALHATPDGRLETVVEQTSLPTFPAGEITTTEAVELMVKAIEATTGRMREVHDAVDADDASTADLLHEFLIKLEQQTWFIGSELRSADK